MGQLLGSILRNSHLRDLASLGTSALTELPFNFQRDFIIDDDEKCLAYNGIGMMANLGTAGESLVTIGGLFEAGHFELLGNFG